MVGYWIEQETGGISELLFQADGDFSVTWVPLEIYIDYWGTYTYDLNNDFLEFTITGSRIKTPSQFDGRGSFSLDDDGLMLTGICLGDYVDPYTPPATNCDHRFIRR